MEYDGRIQISANGNLRLSTPYLMPIAGIAGIAEIAAF